MRDEDRSIWNIKINSINLTLTAENRSQKVKNRRKIANCRFSSGETRLTGIKFSVVRNMIMYNEFKQFRDITEIINGSVIAYSDTIALIKCRYNTIYRNYWD
jgi:hypothetical protein